MARFDARLFMASVRREAGEIINEPISLRKIHRLLSLTGDTFLSQAYKSILHRDIDPVGKKGYAKRSLSFFGRIRIIAALLLSPEQIFVPKWLQYMLLPFRRS